MSTKRGSVITVLVQLFVDILLTQTCVFNRHNYMGSSVHCNYFFYVACAPDWPRGNLRPRARVWLHIPFQAGIHRCRHKHCTVLYSTLLVNWTVLSFTAVTMLRAAVTNMTDRQSIHRTRLQRQTVCHVLILFGETPSYYSIRRC